MEQPRIHIGISGWRYAPWRGVFYPPGLVQRKELHFASRALPTIEINGSFYGLQTPGRYAAWYADTPDDFVFSIKAPRLITHELRLRDTAQAMANFLASGVVNLKHKLGPILWQLPPSLRFDAEILETFLRTLPRDTQTAVELAQANTLEGEVKLTVDRNRPLRHALEVRHGSFETEEFIALLRQHRVALVVADSAGHWPYKEDLCTDFVYMRLHGDEALYSSGYTEEALRRWQQRIHAWSQGGQPADAELISAEPPPSRATRDVYCYFDNDIKVRAPFDAARLLQLLGLKQGLIE